MAELQTELNGSGIDLRLSGLSPQGQAALNKLLALRRLTFETSTVTRRSQNEVLQTLTNADMIIMAELLAEHREKVGW